MKKFLFTLFLAFPIILVFIPEDQIIFAINHNIKINNVFNLYTSVWDTGVLSFKNNSNNRQSMGMSGFGISSLIINHNSNVLLVGTTKCKVLKNMENATSVNKNMELPKESKLYKNYPNPFCPTTTVEFSSPSNNISEMTILQE